MNTNDKQRIQITHIIEQLYHLNLPNLEEIHNRAKALVQKEYEERKKREMEDCDVYP